MANGRLDQRPWWTLPFLILASPFVLVLLFVLLVLHLAASLSLHLAIWSWWSGRGLDVLFVYSNSPVWQSRIETDVLPPLRGRAIVLNWSERQHWRFGLASAAFRHFGGEREFNPLAVVFRPFRRSRVFRFWQPFRDWKHGKVEPLLRMEAEFFDAVGVERDHDAA